MFRRPGSHIGIPGAAILGFALSTFAASAAAPSASPVGTWLTESGHGVVEIAKCGDALCGRIVGIDREPGSTMANRRERPPAMWADHHLEREVRYHVAAATGEIGLVLCD